MGIIGGKVESVESCSSSELRSVVESRENLEGDLECNDIYGVLGRKEISSFVLEPSRSETVSTYLL